MIRNVNIDLQFQPEIPFPPDSPEKLHNEACANDKITVDFWRKIWLTQIKQNHEKHGPFKDKGIGHFHKYFYQRPVICVGSGPSLANNVDQLKNTKGIPIISCLHNYHYLEDRGINPEFYVTLDAGEVTLEEIAEGGAKTHEEYLASTKDKTLLAFTGAYPKLVDNWLGKVFWFMAPIPDQGIKDAVAKIEDFHTLVGSGGNVLGACFYIAKAIMGANPVVFVGADFSFSYENKFHAWSSKYDANLGNFMRATDVFGNSVKTWDSYYRFKCWFESRFCKVPGNYINASEGGILGSYPAGNISQIKQKALKDVISEFSLCDYTEASCKAPSDNNNLVLF